MDIPQMVRHYAQRAHKDFKRQLDAYQDVTANRPMDLDDDHYAAFRSARASYLIYFNALALDAVGNTAFSDEKVVDRIRDARKSKLRWLMNNKLPLGGIPAATQQIEENAVRQFLSDTAFADTEGE